MRRRAGKIRVNILRFGRDTRAAGANAGVVALAEVDDLDLQRLRNHEVSWLKVEMDYSEEVYIAHALQDHQKQVHLGGQRQRTLAYDHKNGQIQLIPQEVRKQVLLELVLNGR